jgi:TolB-like protein/DNA-binding winged helix-turn-helix (wHTH) protein/Flp pilus assembly protein TadD
MMELSESRIYEFEEFRLDAKSRRLFRHAGGELVPLAPKAVELLLFLVQNAGRMLSKEELLDAVWENSFVEEANLSQTIFVLRKTLGENTKNPRFILTAPNRGYQFIASVKEVIADDEILEESFLSNNNPLKIQNSKSKVEHSNPKSKIQNPKSALFAAAALILLIGFGVYWFYPAAKPATVSEIKTIAVLPFEDLSAGQTEKYLGVSLADALANKFGGLKQITVRPTRTVLKYAENREDASKIGRELQVDAVLDGRIQRIGERIRVSVQLIRTADNATLWAENFDDQFTNFFAVQDSISQKVASSLALRIDEKEREKFNRRGTENAEAYQEYLRGRYFWNKRTAMDLQKAIEHFDNSIEKDSNFALPYTGLADSYQLLAEYGAAAPQESFPKAKDAVKKALEIDDQSAEAHTALAYTQAFYDWDFTGAEESFKRAIELNPNYATAHQWYAEYLIAMGRSDEARTEFERALEIEPVSPIILSDLAALYDHLGNADKEIEQARKVIEIDSNFAYGYFYLGLGLERKGMDAEASETLAKTMLLFGEPPECAEEVKTAFAKNGMKGWWQKRLEQIETRPHLKNFQAYHKALVKIRLGDNEGTLEALNQALERKDRLIINAKYDPRLESLRREPRFQDLLRRIGFYIKKPR